MIYMVEMDFRHPEREAEYVEDSKEPVAREVAQGGFKVVSEHKKQTAGRRTLLHGSRKTRKIN